MRFLFPLVLLLLTRYTFAQNCNWQQQVHYKLQVQLNTIDHSLDGFARIQYSNQSPDTLRFIWFHLWPNAYRTDRTAFSDQLLENGRTDFYFSNRDQRGYINRLDFRVEEQLAETEDHPQYIDIIKLILPKPLPPGAAVTITTPFHVQLPANFSRSGYKDGGYIAAQWYPKAAVYDCDGWHEMPYLDQGEFYNNFGNYEVRITVPENYYVLATGALQDEAEILRIKTSLQIPVTSSIKKTFNPTQKTTNVAKTKPVAPVPIAMKTLLFTQNQVHDFAWAAHNRYMLQHDTLQHSNGQIIDIYTAFKPERAVLWKNSLQMIKNSLRFRNHLLGTYPYPSLSVVEAELGFEGGMEYPCFATIAPPVTEAELELLIEHEVGHNWFQGLLGNNERKFPWLDEGINTYYERRFRNEASRYQQSDKKFRLLQPILTNELLLHTYETVRKDQPLNTSSEVFSENNYWLIAYEKGAQFVQLLEHTMGRDAFDRGMQQYFNQWKFKHPQPHHLQRALQQSSGVQLDTLFQRLTKTGPLTSVSKRKIALHFLTGVTTPTTHAINILPLAGANKYDGLMAGAAITNYTLAPTKFQFLLAPLYATESRQWNGVMRAGYTWYPNQHLQRIHISLSGMRFNSNLFTDTAANKFFTGFSKLVPSIKLVFKEKNPRSTRERYIQWKTFFVNEDFLRFQRDTIPGGNTLTRITKATGSRYLNQLRFVTNNTRTLYPYRAELLAEQTSTFIRLAFTGNYHFNYNTKQGADLRFFAGKFMYLQTPTLLDRFQNSRFHLNMNGARGKEDYTYSNYFIGRNEFEGLASQQLMIRDGGFKVNTDLLANRIGRTDNWLLAINLSSDIPDAINILKILPVHIPLKVYLDMGTYAEAWQPNAEGSRILYNAGLQVSALRNTIQVYIPLLYSRVYRNYFESTIPDKRLRKIIAFSIDIQNLSPNKLDRRIPF